MFVAESLAVSQIKLGFEKSSLFPVEENRSGFLSAVRTVLNFLFRLQDEPVHDHCSRGDAGLILNVSASSLAAFEFDFADQVIFKACRVY
ncbi:hypothetical protein Fuma_01465 [Fuerstiella marisgermanici]|uniref:Uncharacterized protein n=1 Tax=Fuerstiella marisgermanici TaxID=1891926 RepID=A0A1P8WCU8_9PLAN|nr:hypothetical protein Fuma_01465 [Fuerstiella marisgermanici]